MLDLARRVTGSQAVEVDGIGFGVFEPMTREVEVFLAGTESEPVPDTVLTTVLFTDIVGSTERAAELGDRAWRDLLRDHHAVVRRELGRFRGDELDTAGDGFFAFIRPEFLRGPEVVPGKLLQRRDRDGRGKKPGDSGKLPARLHLQTDRRAGVFG